MKNAWFKNGLCFECTGCGACCTGAPGYVWISDEEIDRIASFLSLSRETFIRLHVRKVNGRQCLIEMPKTYDCVFFKNRRCTIYPVRPTQCRTYPWWPQVLESEETWNEEAQRCEGISACAEKVASEEIESQLKKQVEYNSH